MTLQKSREVIYIAGPFTSDDPRKVIENCNKATALGERVRAFGLVPFVPHTGLAGSIAELAQDSEIFDTECGCDLRTRLVGDGCEVCNPEVREAWRTEVVTLSLPKLTWDQAMQDCRELLLRCDAVLMVDGWEKSRGAVEERGLALLHGLPVFDTFAELVFAGLGVKKAEVTP